MLQSRIVTVDGGKVYNYQNNEFGELIQKKKRVKTAKSTQGGLMTGRINKYTVMNPNGS